MNDIRLIIEAIFCAVILLSFHRGYRFKLVEVENKYKELLRVEREEKLTYKRLYENAPLVKGKDQQLPIFKSVPKANGDLEYRTVGQKTYSAKQAEVLLYNAGRDRVKVIRTYWQLYKNGWRKSGSEELIIKESEVCKEFTYTDQYCGFQDKIVDLWQLVK